MKRSLFLALLVGAIALVALPVLGAQGANSHANSRAVCPNPPAGYAHCHVLVVTDSHGNPLASSSPTGLDPATIKSVYGFPTTTSTLPGTGQTIAIVDAYNDPNAESDLNTFSSQFSDVPSCTSASGCFTKVDQNGGTNYPRTNSGWALEISLDIEWAHAIAPGANILLVEANSSSMSNLLKAEDYAAANADYVSNSWGGSESSGETSYDSHFSHSGVSFFVSAGDSGLPAEYPSASRNVISVGGTTLTNDGNGKWSETGWSSGGGGCSAYETANPAQSGFSEYSQVNCGGMRATPDVSLDANPSSGVSVYDSVKYQGQQGWFTVGGTSVSSPIWAAASADTGTGVNSSTVYGNSLNFNDVTVGNNGAPCLVGYDLCTGRGSWIYNSSNSALTGGGGSTSTPTASFTYTCTYLNCDFTDSSSDSGGSIQSWSWNFGDSTSTSNTSSAQDPSHTYSSGGTYTVKLTVTDNNQVSASTTHTFTVTAQPTSGISLAASGYKTKGLEYVQLNWRGSSSVDVYRDGSEVAAAVSGTSYLDPTGNRGGATFQYQVCDAGSTTTCSNTVNVSF